MENNNKKLYFDNIKYISDYKNNKNIYLVLNTTNNNYYLQKVLKYYDKTIYDYLIKHPVQNIPRIISTKFVGKKLAVLEEYVEGKTLTEYLKENKPLDKKIFYKLLYKLCDILNILHNTKPTIIHRDIKPSNIVILPNNELYLIDFNSAKFYDNSDNKDTRILGTVDYAAPEQYVGFSNPKSDIYAFGVLINDCIDYFDDDELYEKFKPIIDKCVNISYNERYKNIKELKMSILKTEYNIFFLSIPGFRTNNIYHILLASITYLSLIYFCFFSKIYYNFYSNLATFLIIIVFIFTFFDYIGIQRLFPPTKSNNIFISTISKILFSSIITFIVAIILLYAI